MLAIVKATRERVDVDYYFDDNVYVASSTGVFYNREELNLYNPYTGKWEKETIENDKSSNMEEEKNIDWEERRYQIAKDILLRTINSGPGDTDTDVDFAVEYADALIEKLKRK